jgi:phage baseplate assembly protein W
MARQLSKEDQGLNQTSLVTSRSRISQDLDLTFTPKPDGDLYIKKDAAAVRQAVKTLILTNHFEKPFDPFFGGNVKALLFELAYDDAAEEVKSNIIEAIETYEPRATIEDLKVTIRPDAHSLDVYLEFRVTNSDELVTFTTVVSRLR